jgi:hypothetical protein
VQPNPRPLPESLTRLLAPPPRSAATAPPPVARGPHRPTRGPARRSAHAALEAALLRGFVYTVSGLVWLMVMALVVHHVAR